MEQGKAYEDFEPKQDSVPENDRETLLLLLPGFRKEELRVQLTSSAILKISGERHLDGNKWSRFHKELRVPDHCDTARISARFENGVLFIIQPRKLTPVQQRQELQKLATIKDPLPPPLSSSAPQHDGRAPEMPLPPHSHREEPRRPQPAAHAPPQGPQPLSNAPPQGPKPPLHAPPAPVIADGGDVRSAMDRWDRKTSGNASLRDSPKSNLNGVNDSEKMTAREGVKSDGEAGASGASGSAMPELLEPVEAAAGSTPGGKSADAAAATEKGDPSGGAMQQRFAWGALKEKRNWGEWRKVVVAALLGILIGMYVKHYVTSFQEPENQ